MKLHALHVRGLFALLVLVAMSAFMGGCGCGDDDDDDDSSADDDSADDDATDDDTPDDDATDDDTDDDTSDDDADDDTDDDDADDDTSDDDTSDDDTGDDDSAGPLVDVDFDDYDTGLLGAPWSVTANGASIAEIVLVAKDGSGKELLITGGSAQNDLLYANYAFDASMENAFIAFDLWRASGAAFRFGAADSDGTNRFIARVEGTGALWASNPSSLESCNVVVPAETWVELRVELTQSGTPGYDILVDGVGTDCTDFAFLEASDPNIARIHIGDDSLVNYGGSVYYDNLVVDLL